MRKFVSILLVMALVFIPLAAFAQQQQQSQPQQQQQRQAQSQQQAGQQQQQQSQLPQGLFRASRLKSLQAVGTGGQQLGTVQDAWITPEGEISYLVISTKENENFLVQPSGLQIRQNRLVINQQQAQQAIQIQGEGRPEQVSQSAFRASELTQFQINGQNGQQIGSLEDAVLDIQQGRLVYAAVSFDSAQMGAQQQYVAIPISDLEFDVENQTASLPVSQQMIRQMSGQIGFSQDQWPREANQRWQQQLQQQGQLSQQQQTQAQQPGQQQGQISQQQRSQQQAQAQQPGQQQGQVARQQQGQQGQQAEAEAGVQTQLQADVETELMVSREQPQVTVRQQAPQVTVTIPKPIVTVTIPEPQVDVQMPEPQISVQQAKPDVQVRMGRLQVEGAQANATSSEQLKQQQDQLQAQVQVEQQEPQIRIQQEQPEVRITRAGDQQQGQQQQQQSGAERQAQAQQPGQQQGQVSRQQTSQQQGQQQQAGSMMRVSQLSESQVMGPQNQQVGQVQDVWLTSGGEVSYLVLDIRQGIGNQDPGTYLASPDAVEVQNNQVSLQQTQGLTRVEGEGRPQQVAQSSVRASDLMEYRLVGQNGEQLGTIEDIAVDMQQGRVLYTAVSFSVGQLGAEQRMVAVPYSDILYNLNDQTVTINVTPQALEQAPSDIGFSQGNWPNSANQQWRQQLQQGSGSQQQGQAAQQQGSQQQSR